MNSASYNPRGEPPAIEEQKELGRTGPRDIIGPLASDSETESLVRLTGRQIQYLADPETRGQYLLYTSTMERSAIERDTKAVERWNAAKRRRWMKHPIEEVLQFPNKERSDS